MRIVIPAPGSRGKIQPHINLRQGLQRAGHDAVPASLPGLRGGAESHAVELASLGPDANPVAACGMECAERTS
jgi:UDP:flavonoid glycosyltransferase YjiC (YdhE family)